MLSSVTNALRVLEFLIEQDEAGVSETARALDLTAGSTHRMIATLVELGYVEQNSENRRYRPGPKIPDLARTIRGTGDFVELAHGYLTKLMEEAGETVNLGVLRDDQIVYIDRAVTDQPLAVAVSIGSRVPAYCTSLGRAILAFSEEQVVDDYLDRLPELAVGADQPRPSVEELQSILREARENGFAEDKGEFSPDIACVAAPIVDSQQCAAAAVSIAGPLSRIPKRRDELVPLVKVTAKELSGLLQTMGESRV